MKEFFNQWAFKHPTTKDLEIVAEKVSGMELDWFFDQWLKTTRKCDYSIEKFNGKWTIKDGQRKYTAKIRLRNKGQIVMPIDLYFYFNDGTYQKVIIPLDLQLKPKRDPGAITLDFWYWVNPTYEFEIDFDKEVKFVEIDSRLKLKDINRLNNKTSLFNKVQIKLLEQTYLNPPIDKYWLTLKPSIWFAQMNGARVGTLINGAYLFDFYKVNLGFWYNLKPQDFDYFLNYNNNTSKILGRLSEFGIEVFKLHGLRRIYFEISKDIRPLYLTIPPFYKITLFFEHTSPVENKLKFAKLNFEGKIYSVGLKAQMNYFSQSSSILSFNFNFKTTTANSSKNFTNIFSNIEIKDKFIVFDLSARLNLVQTFGDPPIQERFYLIANPYEQFLNQPFRMIYLIDSSFSEKSKLFLKGGLNLRGYFDRADIWVKSGASINIDFTLLKLRNLPILRNLDFSYFSDIGLLDFPDDKKYELWHDHGFEIKIQPLTFIPSILENLINRFNRLSVNAIFPVVRGSERPKFRWAIEIKVET
jgi:hypothetical protein